jgi:hypothetical protein
MQMRTSSFIGPRSVIAAALLLVLLVLSGCTAERHWGGSSRTGEGGKIKIGLVTKTESNPYFVKLRDAARAAADAHGAEVIALAGRFDGDNEGQVTAIENLVRQGVSGILITPSSTGGVLGAIKSARQQGVIVIALDTATEPEDVVDATFATNARQRCPSIDAKTITPHVLRHSTAMTLLHAGVDTSVIALWLGHEKTDTVQIYLHADLRLKERALARTTPLHTAPGRYRPPDTLLAFLEAL